MPSIEEKILLLQSNEKKEKYKSIRKQKVDTWRKLKQERGKLSEQEVAKNAPKEYRSATPVGIAKHSILKKKRFDETKIVDPRHGIKNKLQKFDPRYGFLEDMLRNELEEFYKKYDAIDANENPKEKLEWKKKIDRHETRLNGIVQGKLRDEIEKDYYKKQAEVIEKTGQAPHALSKKRLDALVKVKQYEQLKDNGNLEKYLKKKRKRNFEKDVKKMLPDTKRRRTD